MKDEFGFKRVSFENWLTIDRAWNDVVMSNLPGDPIAGWIAELNAVNLAPAVPVEVRKLFDVARSTIVYSVLYCPFLALGAEQMLRTAESAASNKCKAMSAPVLKNFAQKIDWLAKVGILNAEQKARWHDVRELRNDGTHAADQAILNVPLALDKMDIVVELIDDLFR